MRITPLEIPDVLICEPKVFGDDRGFFYESFNQRVFDRAVGRAVTFVQDNHSRSTRGVLRGLHYQLPPDAQGKLVRVVDGEVFDVAVDIRRHSDTFGQWVGARLSAENKQQLWIPEGFAHGFITISPTADFLYKTTQFYAPESERSIIYNDPSISIDWPKTIEPRLSDKDAAALSLEEAELFG